MYGNLQQNISIYVMIHLHDIDVLMILVIWVFLKTRGISSYPVKVVQN